MPPGDDSATVTVTASGLDAVTESGLNLQPSACCEALRQQFEQLQSDYKVSVVILMFSNIAITVTVN